MKMTASELIESEYECNAMVYIRDGKALVVLNNLTFDLPPGTKIPLYRGEENVLVEAHPSSVASFLNGHSII